MNKVILMGRLTRDPEMRTTQNGTTIARYTLAVDRQYSQEPETDFFNCTAFGKAAEFAYRYLKKGMKVLVTGRIENGSYKNKDGNTVNTTTIMLESQEFTESRKDSSAAPTKPKQDGFQAYDDASEDLPF